MSKKEAIRLLKTYRNCLFGILTEPIDMAIWALEQEPKTGHWTIDKGSLDALYGEVCKCSECGMESIGVSNYCPNCGCRMVEPQKSEG